MSIRNHPLWPEIAPHVKIEFYGKQNTEKKKFRLEFYDSTITPQQKKVWIGIQVPCAKCGRLIHPIRKRTPGGRADGKIGHVYLAVCCPLEENMGCSRGEAASTEYMRIRREIENRCIQEPPTPQQSELTL